MKIRVVEVNWRRQEATLQAFGEQRTVALLPIAGRDDEFQFYGVMYRMHPKDEHLIQRPTLLRRALPEEATTRQKAGDWFVPKLSAENGFVPVAVAWLKVTNPAIF